MTVGDLVKYKSKFHIIIKSYGAMVALSDKPKNQVFPRKELEAVK
jgi:hypothetical protein